MTKSLLEISPVSHLRRNHALEHATLNILTRSGKLKTSLLGLSDPLGFWVLGDIDTDDLQDAVNQALERLHQGEASLAITPYCGTNFFLAGVMGGLAGWLAMLNTGPGLRRKLERLPLVMVLVSFATSIAVPLGSVLQVNVTTCPQPGRLRVTEMRIFERGGKTRAHRITTKDG